MMPIENLPFLEIPESILHCFLLICDNDPWARSHDDKELLEEFKEALLGLVVDDYKTDWLNVHIVIERNKDPSRILPIFSSFSDDVVG